MADKKSFSLDGLLGGDFWSGVGEDVKKSVADAIIGILNKSGALTGAQAGLLNAQRDGAVLDAENRKLREAGIRPGQYIGWRQREEILHPEDRATRLERIGFHGGIGLDGRFYTSYDQWRAAGGPQARKNFWEGMSKWRGQGSGRSLTKEELDVLNNSIKSHRSAITVSDAKDAHGNVVVAKRPHVGGNTERKARVSRDGTLILSWENPGGSNPAKNRFWSDKAAKLSGSASRDKDIDEVFTIIDEARKESRAAYGGGQSLRSRFLYEPWARPSTILETNFRDKWTDHGFSSTFPREYEPWEYKPWEYEPRARPSPIIGGRRLLPSWVVRPDPFWKSRPAEFGVHGDHHGRVGYLLRGSMFSASKGDETMRGRGWLDAVFAKAERAAARGGRTHR